MTKITENAIETFCTELLEKQGYETIYAPDIAPDSDNPQRRRVVSQVLKANLKVTAKKVWSGTHRTAVYCIGYRASAMMQPYPRNPH